MELFRAVCTTPHSRFLAAYTVMRAFPDPRKTVAKGRLLRKTHSTSSYAPMQSKSGPNVLQRSSYCEGHKARQEVFGNSRSYLDRKFVYAGTCSPT